jgi:hypothetical protein
MALVELAAQDFHDGIVVESFESLHGMTVTHDRKSKTRASGLSVHDDRTSAACSVLAPQMRGCQSATIAQEIRKCFPRLHVVGDFGAI